jgi:hypothetical protein
LRLCDAGRAVNASRKLKGVGTSKSSEQMFVEVFAVGQRPSHVTAALLEVLSLVVLAPGTAHAEPVDQVARAQEEFVREHGDRPIAAIRVGGLRRTRSGVVNQWIECVVGESLSSCDLPRIRDRLYRLDIFSAVDVALNEQPAGVEIVFRFEEKWTLYPVPMFWYTPGTLIAGVVIAEANLLGYNKGVAIGGVYSNRGWYTLAGYNDPNIAYTSLWGSVHAFLGSGLVENDAPDGSIEQSFDLSRFDLEYVLGWTFWDRVSPAWTGALRVARVGAEHVPGSEPAADASVGVQGFRVIYSDRRYREFYDEGLRLSAEVQHAFPLDRASPAYNDAIFDARWARPAPLGGFLDAHAHAFVGVMPIAFEERLGGLDGSRTLPGSGLVAADRYASLALAYQVPLLTFAPGTATGQVFGEVGRYARNAESAVTYGGPGVGLRFYLKRVAIPALGMDVGYEVASKRVSFSLAVGYRPLR